MHLISRQISSDILPDPVLEGLLVLLTLQVMTKKVVYTVNTAVPQR